MTKEEIKALVAAKIAGQGTMVDAGSALPTIIDAIVDLIPEAADNILRPTWDSNNEEYHCTMAEYQKFIEGKINVVIFPDAGDEADRVSTQIFAHITSGSGMLYVRVEDDVRVEIMAVG